MMAHQAGFVWRAAGSAGSSLDLLFVEFLEDPTDTSWWNQAEPAKWTISPVLILNYFNLLKPIWTILDPKM